MKKLLLTLPFLFAAPAHADTVTEMFSPSPYIGASFGNGSTKIKISRKRVDRLDLQQVAIKAGVKWKYARVEAGYDYLPNRLSNTHLVSGTIATQYPIGKFTPFIGGGAGSSYNDKQGRVPVYIATGGVEYSVTDNWSVEARYRFIHPVQHSAKPTHIATVGIIFKF